ncbi:hypothetical protein [Streptomyces fragilis]|uniref:RNA polymerase sigma factor 70 region 4 type 2 domain-containing protein n=1 Tax=Streptomyces fragilis TaxID=67301 RepID=A0ABV2YEI9_9ACTN|nr:hypothetical protein [Streptomyces fragilis]
MTALGVGGGWGQEEFRVFAAASGGRLLRTATLFTAEDPRDCPSARRLLAEALARTCARWGRRMDGEDPYDLARAELTRGYLRRIRFRRGVRDGWRGQGSGRDRGDRSGAVPPGSAGDLAPLAELRPLARLVLVLRLHEEIDPERAGVLLGLTPGRVEALTTRAASGFAAGTGPQCEAAARRALGAVRLPATPVGLPERALAEGRRLRRRSRVVRGAGVVAVLLGVGVLVAVALRGQGAWG